MTGRMTGSDVQGKFLTADTVALDADGISAAAAVGNNAALTIAVALPVSSVPTVVIAKPSISDLL